MKTIYDYSYSGLEELVLSLGWKNTGPIRFFQWLYRKHATSFDQMTDLSKGNDRGAEGTVLHQSDPAC